MELLRRICAYLGIARLLGSTVVMRFIVFISLLLLASPAFAQVEVGTLFPAEIDTPIDYDGVAAPGEGELRWSHTLQHPGATYLAVHFSQFDLGPGDYLVMTDNEGGQEYILTGKGKRQAQVFWARHIKGDTVVMHLIVVGAQGGRGFSMDEYAAGNATFKEDPTPEVVHGSDDRENAACYMDSHPEMYERGRAVVRLLISGSRLCTGSLVSPYNHVLTNNHCIYSETQALNTDVELMSEAPTCSDDNCPLCWPGEVFSGATFVTTDGALDFTLIHLNEGDPASTYGHLDFDNRPPIVGEQIYFPQHPDGRAKEFAIFSTHPADTGGVARIQSVSEPPCQGGSHLEVGYYADSEGGASGSPILAASSHKIIALHHCGGPLNLAVPAHLIYPLVRNDLFGFGLEGRIAPGAVAVSADTSQPGQEPHQAVDGDINRGWMSSDVSGPHWLQLDLGMYAPIYGFKVWHASAAGGGVLQNTQAFRIESADTPVGPWDTQFVGDNSDGEEVSEFAYGLPRLLRHVRLYITDPGNDLAARIPEFEVLSQSPMEAAYPSGPNVALQAASVETSSIFGSAWVGGLAVDGVVSESSKWVSNDIYPPHMLTLDLGGVQPVIGFILRQPSGAGEASHFNATRFSFQSARSMSGPWFTESSEVTDGSSDFEARRFIAPKDLRYVRLHIDDPGIDHIARVPEFEVIALEGIFASFDAVPRRGSVSLTVQFMDRSAGDVTNWSWSFGDGDTSDTQNPSHTYVDIGLHTVSLTVAGPAGSETRTRVEFIEVLPVPADFDTDGDVDQSDFGHLQACLSGSGIEQVDPLCADARLDVDADVDQDDITLFQRCMNGADLPPPPTCGD